MKTHNISFSIQIKIITLNYPNSAARCFSKGLKNKFETAMVIEPSEFEPLKFYCILTYFAKKCAKAPHIFQQKWQCFCIHLDGWMDGRTDGRKDGRTDGRTDGWMDGLLLMSFSTVLQSYQDDGQMIMKDCVQWNPVYSKKKISLSWA